MAIQGKKDRKNHLKGGGTTIGSTTEVVKPLAEQIEEAKNGLNDREIDAVEAAIVRIIFVSKGAIPRSIKDEDEYRFRSKIKREPIDVADDVIEAVHDKLLTAQNKPRKEKDWGDSGETHSESIAIKLLLACEERKELEPFIGKMLDLLHARIIEMFPHSAEIEHTHGFGHGNNPDSEPWKWNK